VAPLTFEVASVKVAASGGVRGGCHGIDGSAQNGPDDPPPPLGRCVITGARLGHLVAIAFGLSSMHDLSVRPDWAQEVRFDVDARSEDPAKTTQKQLLTMLQNLLVERFRMKSHYQASEATGFSLTVAKGGPKLRESKSNEPKVFFTGPQGETLGKPTGQAISLNAQRYSMAMLANLLTVVGQSGPGVDRTGLSGEYDFTLSWDSEAGPALSTALRQLGLQMKSEKVPVSMFVVDAAEKPTSN
jgi:uncharacterized protein (TIGR03435 family)